MSIGTAITIIRKKIPTFMLDENKGGIVGDGGVAIGPWVGVGVGGLVGMKVGVRMGMVVGT